MKDHAPLKILQVMAGAPHGGAETAFVDMCLAMHEAGQIQEIVTRANPIRVPQLRGAGLKVHTLPFGAALDIYTPWAIRRIIQKFQPDIVQTWMSRAGQKIPKAAGDKDYLVCSRLGGYYKLKNFKQTDIFTTITPKIREFLIENGVEPDSVRHINNFAETEISPQKLSRVGDMNTPEDSFVMLALGRLHESKALDVLIKAMTDLPDKIVLWIAGEGPDREQLKNLIATLRLEKRVKLLGWRSDRAALFQACDICVFPSRYEPFGTVFVQSWAQERPVITSTADGPIQFVRDGEDGLIFPIDDEAALKAAILRLYEDKGLRQNLVKNGLKRYKNEFTKDQCVKNYIGFYQEVLERKGLR